MPTDETRTALILALAKNERNLELIQSLLRDEQYRTSTVWAIAEFERLLSELDALDLAIVDVDGFTTDIWDACDRVAERNVPILVVASTVSAMLRQEALAHGVRIVLEKPVRMGELRRTIRTLLDADHQ